MAEARPGTRELSVKPKAPQLLLRVTDKNISCIPHCLAPQDKQRKQKGEERPYHTETIHLRRHYFSSCGTKSMKVAIRRLEGSSRFDGPGSLEAAVVLPAPRAGVSPETNSMVELGIVAREYQRFIGDTTK